MVTDIQELFKDKTSFNSDISNWDMGAVTTMGYMFQGASAFNADISNWNVSGVISMYAFCIFIQS